MWGQEHWFFTEECTDLLSLDPKQWCSDYLYSAYTVLEFKKNLEMIQSIREDILRLHANTIVSMDFGICWGPGIDPPRI